MKKVLLALVGILLFALLAGAILYVALFMEDEPAMPVDASSESSASASQAEPQLEVYAHAETPADVLEALDYEISANRDTVGWLIVPGTEINNSVLQSHDNTA